LAALIIQRCWQCHKNKMLFRLLKHSACAAEHCLTYQILRTISPTEAELLKDPSMQCRVRFRFDGKEFPPRIVFKIFHHGGGHGSKYISGKRAIGPASEAAADACRLMGHRRFYDQMIFDEIQRQQKNKIVDEIDIGTKKDYMQYISNLDETPAIHGGRDNYWRRLSLESLSRSTIMYDVVEFAQSGILSQQLKDELPVLLQQPVTEEIRLKQLRIISRPRFFVTAPSSAASQVRSKRKTPTSGQTTRRSQKAVQKMAKMKKIYGLTAKKETAHCPMSENDRLSWTSDAIDKVHFVSQMVSDNEWEQEADKLYDWTQRLSLEDLGLWSPVAE
uniref:Uncharacterized protein n=1 Tax=Latimeria chalumnae TaxID=7897 RepID=H3ACK7_LATCH